TDAVGKAHARVSAIVLGSQQGSDLSALVDRSGGTSTTAASGTFPQAVDALAHRIGNQYLLSYQSVAAPGDRLNFSIDVKGQTFQTSATVPSSATPLVSPTPNPALFSGTHGYVLIIVIIVALLVLTSIPGRMRARRRARGGGGGGRG